MQHYRVSSCIDAMPHARICVIVTHAPIASPMFDSARITTIIVRLSSMFIDLVLCKYLIFRNKNTVTSNIKTQVERVTYMNTKWSRPPPFIERNDLRAVHVEHDILHKNRKWPFSTTSLSHNKSSIWRLRPQTKWPCISAKQLYNSLHAAQNPATILQSFFSSIILKFFMTASFTPTYLKAVNF
jgi:hypothetical protein